MFFVGIFFNYFLCALLINKDVTFFFKRKYDSISDNIVADYDNSWTKIIEFFHTRDVVDIPINMQYTCK